MTKKTIGAILLAASLVSCTKTGADIFRGYYSFKTGGYVDITGKVYEIQRDTVSIDTLVNTVTIAGIEFRDTSYRYNTVNDTLSSHDTLFVRHIANESGQMRVLSDEGDKVKVTFNITGGAPVVFDGQVDGSTLRLAPQTRNVTLYSNSGNTGQSVTRLLKVSAGGSRYENTIILDLDLQGDYSSYGLEGIITASHVNCIAVENE